MLANNSKRIRHRKLTRGLYSGSDWRVRFEQNRCSSSGQNIEATKYHAKADQKNDSLLSSSARSTRIKRKKEAGGRGARGKETESDVEGEMGMGGGERGKRVKRFGNRIRKNVDREKKRGVESPSLLSPRPPTFT